MSTFVTSTWIFPELGLCAKCRLLLGNRACASCDWPRLYGIARTFISSKSVGMDRSRAMLISYRHIPVLLQASPADYNEKCLRDRLYCALFRTSGVAEAVVTWVKSRTETTRSLEYVSRGLPFPETHHSASAGRRVWRGGVRGAQRRAGGGLESRHMAGIIP